MVQITIRGQNSHFLECTGAENVAELKVHTGNLHMVVT